MTALFCCIAAIVVCAMVCYSWIASTNIKAKCGSENDSDCVGFEHPEVDDEDMEDEENDEGERRMVLPRV